MKNDIHNISNELYTNRQQARIDKENKERKKKYNLLLSQYLKEEIDDYINSNCDYDIDKIELLILNNKMDFLDNVAYRIIATKRFKATISQVIEDLDDIFLKEYNKTISYYKTKSKMEKKEQEKTIYNLIYNRLCYTFDYFNNQRQYDMKILLNNMLNEDYIKDLFSELDLDFNNSNLDLFYKAYKTMKTRKKETIKLQVIETKNNKIPLGWKTYGILKIIDKLIK